jgi:hypothetical protein
MYYREKLWWCFFGVGQGFWGFALALFCDAFRPYAGGTHQAILRGPTRGVVVMVYNQEGGWSSERGHEWRPVDLGFHWKGHRERRWKVIQKVWLTVVGKAVPLEGSIWKERRAEEFQSWNVSTDLKFVAAAQLVLVGGGAFKRMYVLIGVLVSVGGDRSLLCVSYREVVKPIVFLFILALWRHLVISASVEWRHRSAILDFFYVPTTSLGDVISWQWWCHLVLEGILRIILKVHITSLGGVSMSRTYSDVLLKLGKNPGWLGRITYTNGIRVISPATDCVCGSFGQPRH